MPGSVSDSSKGPSEDSPYVPDWCYPRGAKMCPCGHHEGYHAGVGKPCVLARKCKCVGLPLVCWSTDDECMEHHPPFDGMRNPQAM
jgi:hypothetical protein